MAVTQDDEDDSSSRSRVIVATAPAVGSLAATQQHNATGGDVISAFVLGWHIAELFHASIPRSAARQQPNVDKLVGVGALDPLTRTRLLLAQVRADLQRVWIFDDSTEEPPDLSEIQSLLDAKERQTGEVRIAVAELHRQLLVALTAADFRLGKAYGLGRALAETALLPDAEHSTTFQQVFASYRLAKLLEWLADLKSAFPPHAAEGVCWSLRAWAAWSEAPDLRQSINEFRPIPHTEGESLGRLLPIGSRRAIKPPWFGGW